VEEVCVLLLVDTAAGTEAAAVEVASVGNDAAVVEGASAGNDAAVDSAVPVVDAADPEGQQASEPSES
jgi:hypothetical protein